MDFDPTENTIEHRANPGEKLTARDFEIYAPKALALSDLNGDGAVTQFELMRHDAVPDPGEDPMTRQTVKFLLDHFDFLSRTGQKVKLDGDFYPSLRESDVDKITDVLEGRTVPSYRQTGKTRYTWGMIGTLVGIGVGGFGILKLVDGAELGLGLQILTVAGGVLAGSGGCATLGWGLGSLVDKQRYHDVGAGEYSAFLQDLQGTESIRAKINKNW